MWVVWLAAAMVGSALTLASFVKVLHAVFLRKASAGLDPAGIREVSACMWAPVATLAAACVVFGVAAHRIPLRFLIAPAVPGRMELFGIWQPGPATAALATAFLLGLLACLCAMRRKARECETYIGGEVLASTHISGVTVGTERDVEVTGVDFYRTIQELPALSFFYRLAEKKVFDAYDAGSRAVFYFVEALRSVHTGVLPMYLTWVIAGLLILIYALAKTG